jgi:hypothetical protein
VLSRAWVAGGTWRWLVASKYLLLPHQQVNHHMRVRVSMWQSSQEPAYSILYRPILTALFRLQVPRTYSWACIPVQ